MKQIIFKTIGQSPLFLGLSEQELDFMLPCLSPHKVNFDKGAFILRNGESVSNIYLLLSGSVHLLKEDHWGNRHILANILPGQIFAESFACSKQPLTVSAVAIEQATVLQLNIQMLLTSCSTACPCHIKMIHNLITILAQKNLAFNEKLTHLSQRTIREKLLSYLSAEAEKQGDSTFTIRFTRQQLADYLSIDRSAMWRELCKMRDAGLLQFEKNHFTLL